MEKYVIEKNSYLRKWVVWKREGSVLILKFRANRKKDCKAWVEKDKKDESKIIQ